MILNKESNRKNYLRDKICKNSKLRSIYKFVIGEYGYNFFIDGKYMLEKGVIYQISNGYKFLKKKDIEKLYGKDKVNKILNKYIKINKNGISVYHGNVKTNFLFNKNNLNFFNLNKNIDLIFNTKLKLIYKKQEIIIPFKELFKNDLKMFKDFLDEIKNNNYPYYINLVLFGKLDGLHLRTFIFENYIKPFIKNNEHLFKKDGNGNTYHSIHNLDIQTINLNYDIFIKQIVNFLEFKVYNDTLNKTVVFSKKETSFLIKNGILDNIEEGKIYDTHSFLSLINKKNKFWNVIDKFYTTAPKWYRKKENKKIKNKDKIFINKVLKNDYDSIDNIGKLKYIRNGSWYYV